MVENNNNQLNCDLETGICGDKSEDIVETINFSNIKPSVTIYYVTDPICSHCWALEPVLRRFEAQYGSNFTLKKVMGGLLEGWNGFADKKNGISKPSDVANHWREVGEHSRMPIDGSVWIDDPLHSSYPPSRVFKVIQQQSNDLATTFLRRAREAVFVFNQNIADKRVLINLVNELGLQGDLIVDRAESEMGNTLLEEDIATSKSLGARGFPTIIMLNEVHKGGEHSPTKSKILMEHLSERERTFPASTTLAFLF